MEEMYARFIKNKKWGAVSFFHQLWNGSTGAYITTCFVVMAPIITTSLRFKYPKGKSFEHRCLLQGHERIKSPGLFGKIWWSRHYFRYNVWPYSRN